MQEETKLTHQELRQWRDSPITRKILEKLQARADDHQTGLCNGSRFHMPNDKPGGPMWTVGVIFGISEIFNLEADEEEENG